MTGRMTLPIFLSLLSGPVPVLGLGPRDESGVRRHTEVRRTVSRPPSSLRSNRPSPTPPLTVPLKIEEVAPIKRKTRLPSTPFQPGMTRLEDLTNFFLLLGR